MQLIKRSHTGPITLQTREATSGSVGTLTGYIAVFNSDSVDLGGYVEQIRPGAFRASLAANDIVCLVNHDYDRLVGRLSSGTLTLTEDSKGLAFSLDIPDTETGRELRTLVERGDVQGCSFGFYIDACKWDDSGRKCYLTSVNLIEVSVGVTFPAYPATSMNLGDERARARARLLLLSV